MFWASGPFQNMIVCLEIKQEQAQDRETHFETVLLPVAKSQPRQELLRKLCGIFSDPQITTKLFKFSSYNIRASMHSRLLRRVVFILRFKLKIEKRAFKSFQVQISLFKVRILVVKVQTLFAIPLRSPS